MGGFDAAADDSLLTNDAFTSRDLGDVNVSICRGRCTL